MSLVLRIPGRPTEGPQPWPAEFANCLPDFTALSTRRFGADYGVITKPRNLSAENNYQLRILEMDLRQGLVTLSAEEGYTPFCMAGNDLILKISLKDRTYEVTLGDHNYFDEDEYNELDEDDRLVYIVPFFSLEVAKDGPAQAIT